MVQPQSLLVLLKPRSKMNIGNAMEPSVTIGLEPKNFVIGACHISHFSCSMEHLIPAAERQVQHSEHPDASVLRIS